MIRNIFEQELLQCKQ